MGLAHLTRVSRAAYSTVQCGSGPEDHIELNSDLLYCERVRKQQSGEG